MNLKLSGALNPTRTSKWLIPGHPAFPTSVMFTLVIMSICRTTGLKFWALGP